MKFTSIKKRTVFCQSKHDHSMFIKNEQYFVTVLLAYVDDIVITGNHVDSIQTLKKHLNLHIKVKYFGTLRYFLGIEIARSKEEICLNQRKYALELIRMQAYLVRRFVTPMEQNGRFTSKDFDDNAG